MSPGDPPSGSLRIDDGFPLGNAALHPDWPEGRFNVSGMFCFDEVILFFLKVVELGFGCRVGIEAVHGAPTVLWNGGRFTGQEFNPADLSARLDKLQSRGVGCFLTFTNHLLETSDLRDANCNVLLDSIARRPDLNGVIVNSELLSKYIAGRYPSLRQVASVTKVAVEGGRGNVSYYNELGKRFYRYVVHLDDYQDPRLLDQLDRTRAEIIVNENCLRGCPRRARHYELTAREHQCVVDRQLTVTGGPGDTLLQRRRAEQEVEQFMADCPANPLNRQIGKRQRNCNFTRNELKSLYDMGFRHFKIQGRNDNAFVFAYDLARYTLEPDCAAPLVYKTLCPVICRSFAAGQAHAR
jgi:collagenase-like PrtC family protease